jgi:hypothetical protein
LIASNLDYKITKKYWSSVNQILQGSDHKKKKGDERLIELNLNYYKIIEKPLYRPSVTRFARAQHNKEIGIKD